MLNFLVNYLYLDKFIHLTLQIIKLFCEHHIFNIINVFHATIFFLIKKMFSKILQQAKIKKIK